MDLEAKTEAHTCREFLDQLSQNQLFIEEIVAQTYLVGISLGVSLSASGYMISVSVVISKRNKLTCINGSRLEDVTLN
jgi:hypothetical protein